jgi:hypothetical protein
MAKMNGLLAPEGGFSRLFALPQRLKPAILLKPVPFKTIGNKRILEKNLLSLRQSH